MKKSFKLLAIAALASMTIVACNNKPAEEAEDTTAIEATVEEQIAEVAEVADTVVAAVEEKAATATKKTTAKKADNTPKIEVKVNEDGANATIETKQKIEDPATKTANLKKRR